MDQTIYYNVEHHEAMGALVVIYFFLSGLGAGAFLTAAACRIFGGVKYAKVEKISAIAALYCSFPGCCASCSISVTHCVFSTCYSTSILPALRLGACG